MTTASAGRLKRGDELELSVDFDAPQVARADQ